MYNSFKFNQSKYNSEKLDSINVAITADLLTITSSFLTPLVVISLEVVEQQTGSGYSSKRKRRVQKEFYVDGIRRFKSKKSFSIKASKITKTKVNFKLNGLVKRLISLEHTTLGIVKSSKSRFYDVLGVRKFKVLGYCDFVGSKRFSNYASLDLSGSILSFDKKEYNLRAIKTIRDFGDYGVTATKRTCLVNNTLLTGTRDITPILFSLDLLDEEVLVS